MLDLYGLGHATFSAGTELIVSQLAHGLAERGHEIHVITPDLSHAEHRGPTEWWWPPQGHPTVGDVVMGAHGFQYSHDLRAPFWVLLSNSIDMELGAVNPSSIMVATLSSVHNGLLCKRMPITAEQCFVTGAGVELPNLFLRKINLVPGRLLWASSADRGIWHMLDIYDHVKAKLPDASLHVAYGFDNHFERQKWSAHSLSELLWEAKRRIEGTEGIEKLGTLPREQLLKEEMATAIHVYPCDPPNVGSQLHGITALEHAACGVPLVLSDVEALPEVFGEVAEVLPVPGSLRKFDQKRKMVGRFDAQDWADVVVDILGDIERYEKMAKASRELAERHTWDNMLDRYEALFQQMIDAKKKPTETAAVA